MNNFYVYSYSTEEDGIFYIGKGKHNRINHSHQECPYCYKMLEARKREGLKVRRKKLFESLTENKAYNWEASLIWFYEPKCNLSPGGHGFLSGKNHLLYGIPKSDKFKKKMSKLLLGEGSPNSKLTWEQVKQIRKMYVSEEVSMVTMSRRFGVSKTCIQQIIENKTWLDKQYEFKTKRKLNFKKAEMIRTLYKTQNLSLFEISKKYNVDKGTIYKIVHDKIWRAQNNDC